MGNTLNTLGLCKKAGKIITGFDAVVAEMASSAKVAGVIAAFDLSDKSKKEIKFHCDKNGKPLFTVDETMEEIEQILGRKTGIIAILDEGLFKIITKRSF